MQKPNFLFKAQFTGKMYLLVVRVKVYLLNHPYIVHSLVKVFKLLQQVDLERKIVKTLAKVLQKVKN